MAGRTWIEKTVDTTGRPCPLRQIPCPGTRKECAWWLDEVISGVGPDGPQAAVQGGCAVLFQYTVLHEVMLESVRTQAAVNGAATEIQKSHQTWDRLLDLAANRDVDLVRRLPHG